MNERNFDLPRYLSVLPLFNGMAASALQRMAAGSQLRRLGRAEMVFRVDEPCTGFCVTVCGKVKLFALSAAGQEKVIELVGPGVSFGEALLFTGGRYNLNAQTLTETLLLTIDRQTVLNELAHDTNLALHMLTVISAQLQGLMRDVQAHALHSGLQRVVDFLLAHADATDPTAATASLPASKATIASRLSLTPEYFSRILHELEAAGLIRIDGRAIRIPDSQRLASCQEAHLRAARPLPRRPGSTVSAASARRASRLRQELLVGA